MGFPPTKDTDEFWGNFRSFFKTADNAWTSLFGDIEPDEDDDEEEGSEEVKYVIFCQKMRELNFAGNLKGLWQGLVDEENVLYPAMLEERVFAVV